ncbi:MAG: hypothetical protein QW050_02365, partial [Candidatus Nitrosocaldaceae archaeon]
SKYGGNITFYNYKEVENAYLEGLHPMDVKNAVSIYLNKIIEPVRKYLSNDPIVSAISNL